MVRILLVALGSLMSIMGLLLMASPVPGGAFMLALGIALLICSSELAASCLRFFRQRFSFLNKGMTWLENHAGETVGGALRRSRPQETL